MVEEAKEVKMPEKWTKEELNKAWNAGTISAAMSVMGNTRKRQNEIVEFLGLLTKEFKEHQHDGVDPGD